MSILSAKTISRLTEFCDAYAKYVEKHNTVYRMTGVYTTKDEDDVDALAKTSDRSYTLAMNSVKNDKEVNYSYGYSPESIEVLTNKIKKTIQLGQSVLTASTFDNNLKQLHDMAVNQCKKNTKGKTVL